LEGGKRGTDSEYMVLGVKFQSTLHLLQDINSAYGSTLRLSYMGSGEDMIRGTWYDATGIRYMVIELSRTEVVNIMMGVEAKWQRQKRRDESQGEKK
jgi:hypothetical protein